MNIYKRNVVSRAKHTDINVLVNYACAMRVASTGDTHFYDGKKLGVNETAKLFDLVNATTLKRYLANPDCALLREMVFALEYDDPT